MDSGGGVEENPPSRDLVIRNVSQEVEGDVRKLLEKYGTITGLTMSPLNMAVAQFKDLEAAKSAKSALQDYELHGNCLKLEFAKPLVRFPTITRRHDHILNFQLVMPLPVTDREMEKLQERLTNMIAHEESIFADDIKITGDEGGDDEVSSFRIACRKAINRGHSLVARGTKLVAKAKDLLSSTPNVVAPVPVGKDRDITVLGLAPAPTTTKRRSYEDDGEETGGSNKKNK